jgi:hypothetical protein
LLVVYKKIVLFRQKFYILQIFDADRLNSVYSECLAAPARTASASDEQITVLKKKLYRYNLVKVDHFGDLFSKYFFHAILDETLIWTFCKTGKLQGHNEQLMAELHNSLSVRSLYEPHVPTFTPLHQSI